MRILRRIFVTIALISVICVASAAPVSLRAKLDSTRLLMGRTMLLHLEVVEQKGSSGEFPIFKHGSDAGIIRLNGDSVELRLPYKVDTLDLGNGKIQLNYRVTLQSFDSGAYVLPPFVYRSGNDSAVSNKVSFKVIPVSVGENDNIAGYADVEDPDSRWYDSLPDFIVNYWWIILSVLLLALSGWILLRRYRKDGVILRKKPQPSPYDVAISGLRRLREAKLWEKGMEREYFTRLTEILRVYLQDRFGINAMEMTSNQIMSTLADNAEVKEKRGYMRQILDVADYVKFAKMRPLPADNIEAFDNAVRFVEETKPVEPVSESDCGKEDKK